MPARQINFSLFVRMNIVLAARRAAIKKKRCKDAAFCCTALAKVCVCTHSRAALLPLTSPKELHSLVAFSPRKNQGIPSTFTRGGVFDVFHSQVLVCSLALPMHGDHLLDHAPENHEPCNQIHTHSLHALLIECIFLL